MVFEVYVIVGSLVISLTENNIPKSMNTYPHLKKSHVVSHKQALAQMHLHSQMQVQMRHLHLHLHLIPSRRVHLHLHLHLIHPHLHLHLHLIQMHLIESNANQMRIKCEPSEITPECS